MAIYAIGDLHLSFKEPKPMDVFGDNWENHADKIRENWISTVKEEDTVLLLGDFSWGMYLKDAKLDFEFIHKLPGKKILLKGNHDYWWTTITSMKKFLKENNFNDIYFLYNNSYCIEDKIIVGTRGWAITDMEEDKKMIKRECNRLELSFQDAISKYGKEKEIVVCMHYPPITKSAIQNEEQLCFVNLMKKYNVKKCLYGHLHGKSHEDAVEGVFYNIDFKLISSDYLDFRLYSLKNEIGIE